MRERSNAQPINRLHFLIHPGFGLIPEFQHGDSIETLQSRNEKLHAKYVQKVRRLKSDELVILFAPTNREDLRRDVRSDAVYTRTIRRLKEILGRRLVVLSDNFNITNPEESKARLAEGLKIAQGRGFQVSPDTNTFAWGEVIDHCVFLGAENANVHGGFLKKTKILPYLTDEILTCNKDGTRRFHSWRVYHELEYSQRGGEFTHIEIG